MNESQTGTTQKYARSVREAVGIISGALSQRAVLGGGRFPDRPDDLHLSSVFGFNSREMLAWSIVSMWLTGVATKSLSPKAGLSDAEDWFLPRDCPQRLSDTLPSREVRLAEGILPTGMDPEFCIGKLPYILDPHGPGSRLSVMRDPGTRTARLRKREQGAFYTPTDVAEYMVSGCLDSFDGDIIPSVFDPACGTGVFLRAALQELRRKYPDSSAYSLAVECLFGADIAPWPLDATAFVLLADVLDCEPRQQQMPGELWRRLRTNLQCIDALLIEPAGADVDSKRADDTEGSRTLLPALFPAMPEGPKVIVGNPPYADLGDSAYSRKYVQAFRTLNAKPSPTAEVYVAFLEQMIRLANRERFAGSLVLPLSLACNVGPQFAAARRLIQGTPGQWRFAFFDREPQALFGEDVKTRNAIVFWAREASSQFSILSTGPLRRWRGEHRARLFEGIGFTRIHGDIRGGIPKVGGDGQVAALERLKARWDRLEQAVQGIRRLSLSEAANAGDDIVLVGNTAYNFLNVFLRPPRTMFNDELRLTGNQLYAIQCANLKDAFAVLGMLAGHLAYWWWLTHGDGFHVSRSFLAKFPFGSGVMRSRDRDLLSDCGSILWSAMNSNPTVSLNRGRTSLAYSPIEYPDVRQSVDRVLVGAAGLDDHFVDELQRISEQTIAAIPQHLVNR